jgi:hypothetical protein
MPYRQKGETMLLTYEILASHIPTFLAFTGVYPEEFMVLLLDFDLAWHTYELGQLIDSCPRGRCPGGGRKSTLHTSESKLLFMLIYVKLYPLQVVLGVLFGMSQSQANEWIHTLTPILRDALERSHHLPERDGSRLAAVLEATEEDLALLDGVERPRQRPCDPDQQRANYSGKKKGHRRKNMVVSPYRQRRVNDLSETVEGRRHDKPMADESELTFPDDITLAQDTGLQGYRPPNVRVCQPKKKPKGREFSQAEKARNTLIARLRIRIEPVIAGIKRSRIVKDIFRNTRAGYDDLVMEVACGLHNLRAECRHWETS